MKLVSIARITGSHGLDGTFKVALKTEYPEVFDYLEFLMLSKGKDVAASLEIEDVKQHGKFLLIKCEGVNDRTSSDKYKGMEIVIPEEALPEADDDEVYWSSIEGSKVIDQDGNEIGILVDYMESSSADIFVIKGEKGESWMVSNNEHHVLNIDEENRVITVDKVGLVGEDI